MCSHIKIVMYAVGKGARVVNVSVPGGFSMTQYCFPMATLIPERKRKAAITEGKMPFSKYRMKPIPIRTANSKKMLTGKKPVSDHRTK